MRTRRTITLDSDVAELVRFAVATIRRPFNRVVNDAIRAGLGAGAPASRGKGKYRTAEHDPGPLRFQNLDSVQEVLARAEGVEYR